MWQLAILYVVAAVVSTACEVTAQYMLLRR